MTYEETYNCKKCGGLYQSKNYGIWPILCGGCYQAEVEAPQKYQVGQIVCWWASTQRSWGWPAALYRIDSVEREEYGWDYNISRKGTWATVYQWQLDRDDIYAPDAQPYEATAARIAPAEAWRQMFNEFIAWG
jgi:hypothetical protein